MRIDIEKYEAGWSRAMSKVDGTLRIDVHAPGVFVFVAGEPLRLRVGLHPGGQQPDAVSVRLDDTEIPLMHDPDLGWAYRDDTQPRSSVTVLDGQRVTVTIETADRNQRWTYLELDRADTSHG